MSLTTTPDFSFRIKNENQVLSDMIDTFMSTNLMINDFTEGSITRSLLESVSIEMEQLYYLTIENMNKAIETSVEDAFGFTNQEATYAYGNIIIGFRNPLANDMYIPKGTLFFSSNKNYSQQYRTQVPYTIRRGTLNAEIEVYCTEKGTVGNVPSGTIDSSLDINGYLLITQNEAFNTGKDKETYEDSKERFRKMIASLAHGTRNSIEYAVESIPEVASCYLYEDNFGEVIVYVCDANGNLPDDLLQKVCDVVELYKVAGVRYIVRPVHKSWVNLNIEVSVDSTLLNTNSFLVYIKDNIEKYINNFKIGQYLFKNDIIQHVMDIDDIGITDCDVGIQISTDEQLANDSYISDSSPSFVGNTEVTQNQLIDPNIYQKDLYGMIGLPDYHIDSNDTPTWESVLVDNLVLNSGFHKDFDDSWDTYLGGHDVANISDDNMYGNSNSLCMNIEDNGRNTYRYVETNKIPVESGDIYSVRCDLKALGLQDNGFMLPILFSNYDTQKDIKPIPMKPKDANYNILTGTSDIEELCITNYEGQTIYDSNNYALEKGYIDSNGFHSNGTDVATDFIKIDPNTYYSVSLSGGFPSTGVTRVCFYNENKECLTTAFEKSNLDSTVTIDPNISPSDAMYMRVCRYATSNNNITNFRIVINNADKYGYWNTTVLSDTNRFMLTEPQLQNGANYTYSINVNNLPCDSLLSVILQHNDGFKQTTFTSPVYQKGYNGTMKVSFTVPQDFGVVDSITLYVKSKDTLGDNPSIPYMRLKDEKLETGNTVTSWYLNKEETINKPLYVYNGVQVTGNSDTWITSNIDGIEIPDGYTTLALRFYVQSFGIMYIAQPQVNKSKTIAPFRVSKLDLTPKYEIPYTDFYPLDTDKYVTAPNEILRCNNINISFIQNDTFSNSTNIDTKTNNLINN